MVHPWFNNLTFTDLSCNHLMAKTTIKLGKEKRKGANKPVLHFLLADGRVTERIAG